ncbi:MAG: hypothetical protein CMJ54_06570 [Planctomycetaceae bacterium]|nr:hypothetical protein [Planctomycetaceae bacterium]
MRSAARLLSEVLLRPGIEHFGPDDLRSIRSPDVVLDLDPPPGGTAFSTDPRLVVAVRSGKAFGRSVECGMSGGEVVRLPSARVDVEIDNGFQCRPSIRNRATAMLTMAVRRRLRSAERDHKADETDLVVGLEVLARAGGSTVREEVASVFERRGVGTIGDDWLEWYRDNARLEGGGDPRLDEVADFIERPAANRFSRFRSLFLADPVLLPLGAIRTPSRAHGSWMEFLESLVPHLDRSKRICAVIGAAMVLGADRLVDRLLLATSTPDWSFQSSSLLRLVPGRENIDRSLLSALVHVSLAAKSGVEVDSLLPRRRETPLEWRGFGSKGIDEGVEPSTMRFYDPDRGTLASDLIENWLLLMEQRTPTRGQFEIQPEHYSGGIEAVEHLLGCIVDDLQIRASGRAVRLRPWPAGRDFALSIRYDVDRPVSSTRVSELAELQRRRCGDECGSWFLLTDAGHSMMVASSLAGTGQEIGRHACDLDRDSFSGEGVTVHSSQWSRYWEGRRSIEAIVTGNADYGESMQFTACTARRAWLGSGAASVWCTPLHFPLEGTVDQADLAYFDRQRSAFDRIRRQGGHLVIGAHPDCEPSLLEALLDRIDLDRVWMAPIGRVVGRLRSLGTTAGVQVRFSGDGVEARADWPIDGLVVEVEDANGVKTYSARNLVAEWGLLGLEGTQDP